METSWEPELANLLSDLLAVQDELLSVLTRKGKMLAEADSEGLLSIVPEEERLAQKLQESLQRREELLSRARRDGLPASDLRELAQSLPRQQRGPLSEQVRAARSRARMLKHHSITNWVVIQRSLLHLSQLLEIIATGGRLQPTYGRGEPVHASGALVDRAA